MNRSGLYFNGSGTAVNPQKLTIRSNITDVTKNRFFARGDTYIVEEYAGNSTQNTVFGEPNNIREGYIGLQNRINLELIINNASGVNLSRPKTISPKVSLLRGTLNNSNNQLTLGNGAIIERSGGSFAQAPNFGSSVNLAYLPFSSFITTGNEIPNTTSVINNFTVSNPNGVRASKKFSN